jgi:hypothetical protein
MLFWRKKSNEYFIIVAWSLSNWFSQTGFLPDVQLSSEGISQLISDLGLTKFLSDDKCVYTDSVFTAAYQGWTSGRYVAVLVKQGLQLWFTLETKMMTINTFYVKSNHATQNKVLFYSILYRFSVCCIFTHTHA